MARANRRAAPIFRFPPPFWVHDLLLSCDKSNCCNLLVTVPSKLSPLLHPQLLEGSFQLPRTGLGPQFSSAGAKDKRYLQTVTTIQRTPCLPGQARWRPPFGVPSGSLQGPSWAKSAGPLTKPLDSAFGSANCTPHIRNR